MPIQYTRVGQQHHYNQQPPASANNVKKPKHQREKSHTANSKSQHRDQYKNQHYKGLITSTAGGSQGAQQQQQLLQHNQQQIQTHYETHRGMDGNYQTQILAKKIQHQQQVQKEKDIKLIVNNYTSLQNSSVGAAVQTASTTMATTFNPSSKQNSRKSAISNNTTTEVLNMGRQNSKISNSGGQQNLQALMISSNEPLYELHRDQIIRSQKRTPTDKKGRSNASGNNVRVSNGFPKMKLDKKSSANAHKNGQGKGALNSSENKSSSLPVNGPSTAIAASRLRSPQLASSPRTNLNNINHGSVQNHSVKKKQTFKSTKNLHRAETDARDHQFLPFTGVDIPFMKNRPQFIRDEQQSEPIHDGYGNNTGYKPPKISSTEVINKIVYDSSFGSHAPMGNQHNHLDQLGYKYVDKLQKYYVLKSASDTTLMFESRFESGNLHRATQVTEFEYDLELRQDYGSANYLTQWFFFKVSNTRANQSYKFNIVNLIKPDSLYNHGMKPLMYSKKQAEQMSIGWYRGGYDVKYYQSKKRNNSTNLPNLYTLSFIVEFKYDSDQAFFAHCYPYTYSDLHQFLKRVCLPSFNKDRLRRTALCKTLAGNTCEMMIITNFLSTQDQIAERKAIILSSRVHPGESNSSFIMEGIIDFILSNAPEAKTLRNIFVFKIIPMLNPDGVISGNYRGNLAGLDLNRQWQMPSYKNATEIYAMKEMVRKTLECRDIHLFVDIHGHSRNKNLFTYGCEQRLGKSGTKSAAYNKEKVLTQLLTRSMDWFSWQDSSFAVQKCKESTGRVVMNKEFGITNSYTLEASFCGPTQGLYKDTHFTQQLLIETGKQFCLTMAKFSDAQEFRKALREISEKQNGGNSISCNQIDLIDKSQQQIVQLMGSSHKSQTQKPIRSKRDQQIPVIAS